MHCNFIEEFRAQLIKARIGMNKTIGANGETTLKELNVTGSLVGEATYEQLNHFSSILANLLRPILQNSTLKVHCDLM